MYINVIHQKKLTTSLVLKYVHNFSCFVKNIILSYIYNMFNMDF
jgi:N12 class adenine-specific DNA methylase